jgi:hypothetical protein
MNQETYQQALDNLVKQLERRKLLLFLGSGASDPPAEELASRLAEGLSSGAWEKSILDVREKAKQAVADSIDEACDNSCGGKNRILETLDKNLDVLHAEYVGAVQKFADRLPEVALVYEAMHDRTELIQFLREQMKGREPKDHHRLLFSLPFDAIYTTHYDRLMEISEEGARRLQVISNYDKFMEVHRRDEEAKNKKIPYYKLHGCIEAGDVCITVEDQIKRHLSIREPHSLFSILRNEVGYKTVLFVGYSLVDTDLIEIIYSGYRQSTDGTGVDPVRSYAVIEHPNPFLKTYWLKEFNIQTIEVAPDKFFADLVHSYRQAQGEIHNRLDVKVSRDHPDIWKQFHRVVEAEAFATFVIFGGYEEDRSTVIGAELATICFQREDVATVELNLAEEGADLWVGADRFTALLKKVAQLLDGEIPDVGILDKFWRRADNWEARATLHVSQYWQDMFGEDNFNELNRVKDGQLTPEERQIQLELRETELAAAASDTFFRLLKRSLRRRRLMVVISHFEEIERDERLFDLVTQYFLNRLSKDIRNVGLILCRQAKDPIEFDKSISTYELVNIKQFSVGSGQGA